MPNSRGSNEEFLEGLRRRAKEDLEQLKAFLRAQNNDAFLLNLTSLEATFQSQEDEAREEYENEMEDAKEMRILGKMPALIEVKEQIAADHYGATLRIHRELLDSFIQDCAPLGFRIVDGG